MNQPLVSVLVPVFHVEEYIERCARSIFGQTYKNLEYVIVDDDTDDTSIEILNSVIEDFPERKTKTSVIHHKEHKGLAAARNTAVAACNGEFVFHVDSDDWVEKDAVELLVNIQQEDNSDIVTAEARVYKDGLWQKYLSGGWNLDKDSLLVALLNRQVSTTIWRRLIRKSLYTDNYIVCDENGDAEEDFQVLPRLVYYSKKVSGINKCIYNYDKSNYLSITNNIKHDVIIQLQLLTSANVVESFFADKEPHLKKLVCGLSVKTIHKYLVYNAIYRNRGGYNTFLQLMKESDSGYWVLVHWNCFLFRLLESNYYLTALIWRMINKTHTYQHRSKNV